jgi:hypothetical protein
MERMMLFDDELPLLEQICARLRHVYCDVTDKTRTLIVLDDTDVPRFDSKFEVDGDDEYDIRSQASDNGKQIVNVPHMRTCWLLLGTLDGLIVVNSPHCIRCHVESYIAV